MHLPELPSILVDITYPEGEVAGEPTCRAYLEENPEQAAEASTVEEAAGTLLQAMGPLHVGTAAHFGWKTEFRQGGAQVRLSFPDTVPQGPRRLTSTEFGFSAPNGTTTLCYINAFDMRDGRRVVVITELPTNPGMSVTNAAEAAASAILQRIGTTPPLQPSSTIFLEHQPAAGGGTFDALTFEASEELAPQVWQVTGPQWARVQLADVGLSLEMFDFGEYSHLVAEEQQPG